jgi:phospholipase C
VSARTLLRALAVTALASLLGPAPALAAGTSTTTPIKHLVVLMQENHTFDNYFGTYPGVDGIPGGVCMPVNPRDRSRGCIEPFHIGSNDVQPADLDHSTSAYRLQYDGGRMDGFVSALSSRKQDGRLAMGHYDERDLPYYWNLADRYVLFDRFFSSASAGSALNHLFWVAAAPGSKDGRLPPHGYTVETIFDRLEARGIPWKFYVQNYEPRLTYRTVDRYPGNRASQITWVPLLEYDRFIDRPSLNRHIVDLDQYFSDLHDGTLPAVSYIAPSGPSEHPPSSIQSGQAFVRSLINALLRSSAWKDTAFIVAYDDWGGWYDHVRPPQVDRWGYGFRVPAFLVSPYAKRGYVDSTELEFSSILRFVEQNWRVAPLTTRDRNAGSLMGAFDFDAPPRTPAVIPTRRHIQQVERGRVGIIYPLYAAALLLCGLLVVAAARATRARGGTPT